MSRNPFPFSIALLAIFSLSPIMVYADGSGDSTSQSLLKEMKNRYLNQGNQMVSPTLPPSPGSGLPPPPSSPSIPPMNGSGAPSTSNGPVSPDASSPIPDQTHTLLRISSNPSGAKMQVDGVLIGDTPVSFEAHAGMSGTVCVTKNGFYSKCFSVFFQGGKTIRTQISLERVPPSNPFAP